MLGNKKELLLPASIPVIFTIGIIAFVIIIPQESWTLNNFISYTSSLSTILMVLAVIITTRQQLKEMHNTRILQIQPLPFITPSEKSHIEAPQFFCDYPNSKAVLMCRFFFYVSMENIGNGSAVAIDIIPKLQYMDKNDNLVTEEYVCERIDSLKPNQKEETDFMLVGVSKESMPQMHECILRNFLYGGHKSLIKLDIFYKNVLGACFKEKMSFEIWFYEEDEEKIKSCLKLLETAKIDYAEDISKLDTLLKSKHTEKTHKLLNKMNKELSKKEGCIEIQFLAEPVMGYFSVTPISENVYQKELKNKSYPHLLWKVKQT